MASSDATADGSTLFGKNSDREPFEAQSVEVVAGREHEAGALTRCTYLDVPAVRRTRTVLLSRPFWMWGAEMGLNDAGVAIGNEAVLTRAPYREGPGLLGMDLLRLALERASSARSALDVITALLEQFGQGGRPSMASGLRYHNSFILADAEQAWVLETADRAWAARRVRSVRAISNGLTLRDDWELACDGLAARARDFGLTPGKGRVDFARTFSRPLMTWGAGARQRRDCTEALLRREAGRLGPEHAMRALRQHGVLDEPERASRSFFMTVCGHASWTPLRSASQTTGSMVCRLSRDGATAFVTATSAPCVSLFKPVWIEAGLPRIGTPGGRYDPSCLWWRHERWHRRALADLASAQSEIRAERAAFETSAVRTASELSARRERSAASRRAFADADAIEASWLERIADRPLPGVAFRRYWQAVDRRTGAAWAP